MGDGAGVGLSPTGDVTVSIPTQVRVRPKRRTDADMTTSGSWEAGAAWRGRASLTKTQSALGPRTQSGRAVKPPLVTGVDHGTPAIHYPCESSSTGVDVVLPVGDLEAAGRAAGRAFARCADRGRSLVPEVERIRAKVATIRDDVDIARGRFVRLAQMARRGMNEADVLDGRLRECERTGLWGAAWGAAVSLFGRWWGGVASLFHFQG